MNATQLERFNELKPHHPHLASEFVGWMTGTAARAEADPSYRPTVLAEVERFLAHYATTANSSSTPV